jgi:hypothetical protein
LKACGDRTEEGSMRKKQEDFFPSEWWSENQEKKQSMECGYKERENDVFKSMSLHTLRKTLTTYSTKKETKTNSRNNSEREIKIIKHNQFHGTLTPFVKNEKKMSPLWSEKTGHHLLQNLLDQNSIKNYRYFIVQCFECQLFLKLDYC